LFSAQSLPSLVQQGDHRMQRLAAAALLAFWAASASAQPAPIAAQRIREDVRALASDAFLGRGPGQPGEARTLDYLVAQFKAAGLKPGGGNGAWLQDVPLTRFDRGPVAAALTFNGGKAQSLVVGRDLTASSHQVGRNRLSEAPIVFVGYGVKVPELGWDSFRGSDLHGKVALILANDPDFDATPDSPAFGKFGGNAMVYPGRFGAKVAAAQAAGAAAVLVIHEDAAASYPWRQVANGDRISGMQLGAPKSGEPGAISGWLHRDVAVRLLRSQGLDLEQLKVAARDPDFRPLPLKRARLSIDFTVKAEPALSHNVLARIPGREQPDEVVIYGAHWDANGKGAPDKRGDDIRNGAVDNGVGAAELLEVARAFAAGPPPRRSVLFIAYTAEEKGLLGSDHYAADPVWPLQRTVAVINLDPHVMLGRARNVELIGPGRTSLEDDLARAAKAEGLRVTPEPHPEAGWYFRSDHYSFARRGVPALAFRIGRDLVEGGLDAGTARSEDYNVRRYHQPDDEFDPKWSFDGAAQEAAVALRVGRGIAAGGDWPTWRPGSEFVGLRPR
jgi:Zn-dependent M28 family amino/carboxypeptidase